MIKLNVVSGTVIATQTSLIYQLASNKEKHCPRFNSRCF